MGWQTEMTEVMRVLLDDMGETPVYSDASILRILAVAAFQVDREMDFANDYTIVVSSQSISPDPTLTATLDESFTNLVCLKAACLVDRSQAGTAARKAFAVKDGGSWYDARDVGKHRITLLEKGWCKAYEEEAVNYQTGQVRVAGAAVLGPFRLYAFGGFRDSRGRETTTY